MALHSKYRPYNIFGTHTLQDLHGPLRPAVPQVQSITILEDATLVVKSQRKNDFDIMYRKRVNEINIADPLSRLGVP